MSPTVKKEERIKLPMTRELQNFLKTLWFSLYFSVPTFGWHCLIGFNERLELIAES